MAACEPEQAPAAGPFRGRHLLGWAAVALGLLFQFALFREFVRREVAWAYPAYHDQACYLLSSYTIYERALEHGLPAGLQTGWELRLPQGVLLHQEAALLYLFVYAFMTIGAFAVITVAARRGDDHHSLDDYRGLALERPVVGGLLIFFMLAQAGVPFTGGFIAKLEVFSAAAQANQYGLLVIGVLASVVAAFFYLRIAYTLLTPRDEPAPALAALRRVDLWSAVVLVACAALVLVVGVVPGSFVHWAKDATFLL